MVHPAYPAMAQIFAKVAFCVAVVAAALLTAGLLAALAHHELGLSPYAIRRAALLGSGLLGIGFFSHRFGRRDQG